MTICEDCGTKDETGPHTPSNCIGVLKWQRDEARSANLPSTAPASTAPSATSSATPGAASSAAALEIADKLAIELDLVLLKAGPNMPKGAKNGNHATKVRELQNDYLKARKEETQT